MVMLKKDIEVLKEENYARLCAITNDLLM